MGDVKIIAVVVGIKKQRAHANARIDRRWEGDVLKPAPEFRACSTTMMLTGKEIRQMRSSTCDA